MSFLKHPFPVLLLAALCVFPAMAVASPVDEAAARIKDRLEQIDQMKLDGKIGEDARGFLQKRETLNPRESGLLEAENADRLVIYQSIAGRTGQTVEEVGRQRALRIAQQARSGVWLKDASGDWYQKP